mgnify:CR=1 FL=1
MKLKKVFTIFAFILVSIGASAQGITFLPEGATFQQAVDYAKKEGKKIFLDCYTSWCGPCKKMARDVFPQAEVGEFMNPQFVSIKIDMEKGEGPELMKKLDVTAFPTFIVFNSEGKVYADRLCFYLPEGFQVRNVTIGGVKEENYKAFEPITLEVQGAPGSSMSVSVRDAAKSEYTYDTGSMLTEALLSSQLKGFVPHPHWYFEKDDAEHRQALDLLMMVQGWRKYVWREMALVGEFELTHTPEKRFPHWTGQVHNYTAVDVMSPPRLPPRKKAARTTPTKSLPKKAAKTAPTRSLRLNHPKKARTEILVLQRMN